MEDKGRCEPRRALRTPAFGLVSDPPACFPELTPFLLNPKVQYLEIGTFHINIDIGLLF